MTITDLHKRWIYMAVAIIASALLFTKPVFNFQQDKGILYMRSFSMTQKEFYVTQTDLSNGVPYITDTMSVRMLYYCNQGMLWGSILCLLSVFDIRWRMIFALVTALLAGAYYIIMMYYAVVISDEYYATLYPNLMTILPAIVCQMMIFLRHNIIHMTIDEDEQELTDWESSHSQRRRSNQ